MEIRKAVLGYVKACFCLGVSETGPSFYRTQKTCNIFIPFDKFSGVLLSVEDFVVSKQAVGFQKRIFIFSDSSNSSVFVIPAFLKSKKVSA